MKHILITGSTRGIGFGLACKFLEKGFKVTINGTSNESIKQALENVRLLALNIITSSGEHYNTNYPTQDFPEFVALLAALFEQFKVKSKIEGAVTDWKVIYNKNRKVATLQLDTQETKKDQKILDLETEHQKAVSLFIIGGTNLGAPHKIKEV